MFASFGCLAVFLILTFAAVCPLHAQGTLTNGWTHTGTIAPIGDSDTWTFSANNGDRLIIRVGKISQTNAFTPRIRLLNPNSVQIATASAAIVPPEIAVTATNTGTFTVIIDDANGAATGTYRLTLAQSPGAVFVAPDDEGGPMTNGVAHTGVLAPGDLDVWTFAAAKGDSIVVKAGQITDTNAFDPWVRLFGPDGVLIGSDSGAFAGEVAVRATNSGTFTVVIANDPYNSATGNGAYLLTLAKTGEPFVVSRGDEGGPLTNGFLHTGNLPLGDLDLWSFTATNGDSIVLKLGQISETNNLVPWIRLYSPDGVLIASDNTKASASEVAIRATNSGTFLVVIANYPYYSDAASGTYLVTLAKTGEPFVVAPGDEGGPLTNGFLHTGNMPLGDLDLWGFTATNGQNIIVKVGQISETNNFVPWIRLYGPDGALIASDNTKVSASEVAIRATNSGTFLVVIANYPYYSDAASGTYLLTLVKSGEPFVTAPGDEGGPLTNGFAHTGNMPLGDLDLWSFTATNGQNIILKLGQMTETNNFAPQIRLFGPNGVLIASNFASSAIEIITRATNSGTFLAVVANYPFYSDAASGTYLLTLAKPGEPFVVAPGDEGGPLTNGFAHIGNMPIGDLDLWSFNATAGQNVILRVGQISETNNFAPLLRLYGPDGQLIATNTGFAVADIALKTTNSGTFLAIVSNNPFYSDAASGTYLLNLAQIGTPFFVAPGDEGGPLFGSNTYSGTIRVGDLDLWSFTACVGEFIDVQVIETTQTNAFGPSVRLYGPDGALVASGSGAVIAEVAFVATNSGSFVAVIGDSDTTGGAVNTPYQLTVNGLLDGLKLCLPIVVGTNVNISAAGGTSNTTFILYTHTNAAAPSMTWHPILTNKFDGVGQFTSTNRFDINEPSRFFRLNLP